MNYTSNFQEFFLEVKKRYYATQYSQDILLLLERCLNVSFGELFTKSTLTKSEYNNICKCIQLMESGMPINKIFGVQNFFGRDFFVNKNVLAPRKETELLVEQTLKLAQEHKYKRVLDMCTGSGCIAISLVLELPNIQVDAVDKSQRALDVATKNAKKLNAQIRFIKSDLFDKIVDRYDIVVSNPPYIKTSDLASLDDGVRLYDPKMSLDGGADGLLFYKKIVRKLPNHLNNNGYVLFEVGYNQAKDVENLLSQNGYQTRIVKDYSNIDRIVIGRKNNKK